MYRRKTVEAILRHHERQQARLLEVIATQNDRLMLLAGQPWTPPPAETSGEELAADDQDNVFAIADPEQLPDEWWDDEPTAA